MDNLHNTINNLSWNMPPDIQQKAIDVLSMIGDKEIHFLIQPGDKSCWENAAFVIRNIGFPRVNPVLPEILCWLQDMNWPGASVIFDFLKSIDKPILVPYIETALKKASDEEDYVWIASMKELLAEIDAHENDFSNKENYRILELAEW